MSETEVAAIVAAAAAVGTLLVLAVHYRNSISEYLDEKAELSRLDKVG